MHCFMLRARSQQEMRDLESSVQATERVFCFVTSWYKLKFEKKKKKKNWAIVEYGGLRFYLIKK
jgi:putative SOS response-associated peptidase YedK